MELLHNESLLENSISVNNTRLEKLLALFNSLNMNHSRLFNKEDARLVVYDIWFLLEYGEKYKEKVNVKEVKKKKWRLLLLEFFAENGLYEQAELTQYCCAEKRFFAALIIVKKLVTGYLPQLEKLWKIQNFKEDVQITNNQNEFERIQNHIFTEIKNKWYIHLFKYESKFKTILEQVVKQLNSVEQVLGPEIWKTIDEDHFDMLMKSIEVNHFAELLFWKEKVEKTAFFSSQTNQNGSYVLCVQQDVSMRDYITIQTAIVLELMKTLQNNEGNLIFVPFGQSIEREMIALKGMFNMDRYFDLNQQIQSKSVPINYKNALNYALLMLKLELSQNDHGKIYFLCNELIYKYLPQDDVWMTAVESYKKNNGLEISVIFLGEKNNFQPIWFADEVLLADQFVSSFKL
ncbi:hypothetical protein MKX47_08635 [Solibacillus sp. FSL R7-0668]|uniref:hypothetical protein n=1 Tax=Solibacillus sp. FSL R7-0668 TaxID=2921688 RepID=UPI0030F7A1DC